MKKQLPIAPTSGLGIRKDRGAAPQSEKKQKKGFFDCLLCCRSKQTPVKQQNTVPPTASPKPGPKGKVEFEWQKSAEKV